MVYVVGNSAFANLYDFAVHLHDGVPGGISDWLASEGIETAPPLYAQPFVFTQTVVVAGVNHSVLRLGEPNPSKGVAIARPAIDQDRSDENSLKPPSKTECAVSIDLFRFRFYFSHREHREHREEENNKEVK